METTLGRAVESIFSGGTSNTKTPKYWNGKYPWLSSGEANKKYL